eukprot:286276_1
MHGCISPCWFTSQATLNGFYSPVLASSVAINCKNSHKGRNNPCGSMPVATMVLGKCATTALRKRGNPARRRDTLKVVTPDMAKEKTRNTECNKMVPHGKKCGRGEAYMGTLSKRNDSASVMNFMECLEDTDVAPDAGVFTSALHACYDRCFDLNDCNVHAVNHIVKEMDKWGVKLTPSHYAQALAILAETGEYKDALSFVDRFGRDEEHVHGITASHYIAALLACMKSKDNIMEGYGPQKAALKLLLIAYNTKTDLPPVAYQLAIFTATLKEDWITCKKVLQLTRKSRIVLGDLGAAAALRCAVLAGR